MYIEVEGQTKPWTQKPTMRKKEIFCNNNKKKKKEIEIKKELQNNEVLKCFKSFFSVYSDKPEIFLNLREKISHDVKSHNLRE